MTGQDGAGRTIRRCGPADTADILTIINAAAEAYRGVIPADCWQEPYMPAGKLVSELTDGVVFNGYEMQNQLVGVMGVQRRRNVNLVRHAYVLPRWQGQGIGARLLEEICRRSECPTLIGTWAAADWAIRFYERHGFERVADHDIAPLLRMYWNVPERQIDTSVVLASPPFADDTANRLIAGANGG